MARRNFDVTEGPLLKKTILFAIPIILTSILQLLFNAADLMVVGTVDEKFVGAVGATGAVTNLIVNLFLGIGGGVSVVVAQNIGARDYKKTHQTVHTAIPVAVISGLILTVVGYFYTDPMLRFMDTPEEILPYSSIYMKIYYLGMIPNLIYNFGAAILRAAGDTKGPLIYLSISGVINVLLNLVFVHIFNMNVDGVAIATITAQAISAVLVMIALMKRQDACRFDIRAMKIDKEALLSIVKIGIPAGLQSSLYSIANIMIQSSVNSFDAVAVTGNSAAINIEGFAYVIMNAFYQSALTFTGQNVGAGKYERVGRVYLVNAMCTVVSGLIVGILFNVGADFFLGLYNVTNPEAVEFGKIRLMYIALLYFSCGVLDVTTGVLRGMGSSFVPMLICVLGVCGLRLLWIFTIFQRIHTPQMLFIVYPISWVITFLAEFVAYKIISSKQIKMSQEALAE